MNFVEVLGIRKLVAGLSLQCCLHQGIQKVPRCTHPKHFPFFPLPFIPLPPSSFSCLPFPSLPPNTLPPSLLSPPPYNGYGVWGYYSSPMFVFAVSVIYVVVAGLATLVGPGRARPPNAFWCNSLPKIYKYANVSPHASHDFLECRFCPYSTFPMQGVYKSNCPEDFQ